MLLKQDRKIIQEELKNLYYKSTNLLAEISIEGTDHARLIRMSPKTLPSMRSQKVNPSFTTIRRISEVLDISIDKLLYDHCKTPHLYEFYWTVPRAIMNIELQDMTCNHVTDHKNMTEFRHRVDIRRDDIYEKRAELKKKEKLESEGYRAPVEPVEIR